MFLDHGFDAMSVAIFFLFSCLPLMHASFPFHYQLLAYSTLLSLQLKWVMVHWEESVTGEFRFPFLSDIEGSTTIFLSNLYVCYFAHTFHAEIAFGFTWREFLLIFMFCTNLFDIIKISFVVSSFLSRASSPLRQSTAAFRSIFPFLAQITLCFFWAYFSPVLMQDYTVLFFIATGGVFGTLALRIILCNLCAGSNKKDYLLPPVLIPVIFAVINTQLMWIDSIFLCIAICVYSCCYYGYSLFRVYSQVTQDMNSSFFSILFFSPIFIV